MPCDISKGDLFVSGGVGNLKAQGEVFVVDNCNAVGKMTSGNLSVGDNVKIGTASEINAIIKSHVEWKTEKEREKRLKEDRLQLEKKEREEYLQKHGQLKIEIENEFPTIPTIEVICGHGDSSQRAKLTTGQNIWARAGKCMATIDSTFPFRFSKQLDSHFFSFNTIEFKVTPGKESIVYLSPTNYHKRLLLVVAVGDNGSILTSPDAITWTKRSSGTSSPLKAAIWTGETFIVVGEEGIILHSPDGTTWTKVATGTTFALTSVAWDGRQLVAVGKNRDGIGVILSSHDGVSWTRRNPKIIAPLNSVTWTGEQFVAVGILATILTSPDGHTWTPQSSGTTELSSSMKGNRLVSLVRVFNSVTWTGNKIAIVGNVNPILTSSNGNSWSKRNSGTDISLRSVTWMGSHLVAVGRSGTILTSTDEIHWTDRSSGTIHHINCVAWTGTQLVAVGEAGTILTSTDGKKWNSNRQVENNLHGLSFSMIPTMAWNQTTEVTDLESIE